MLLKAEGVEGVQARHRTCRLGGNVEDQLRNGERALDVHRQADRGVHVTTADIAKEEDDNRESQTDSQEVAGVEDSSQKQESTEELCEQRNNRDSSHFY